jgi:hypothetical protein
MRIWWWWLIIALLVGVTAITGAGALSHPWAWDTSQTHFLFCLAVLGYVALVWGVTWLRGGNAAVRARWAKVEQMPELIRQRRHGPSRRKQLLIWVGIALALVFVFQLSQHH